MKDLRNRTAVGVVWSFVDMAGGHLVGFLVTVVLARLLQPSDFGLVAMASVFFSIARLFIDSGLRDSLIQNPKNTQADYNVVFFFNLCVSVVLYAIIYFAAPQIAAYYDNPQIIDLVRVLSLVLPFGSIGMIQNAILTRSLRFDVFVKARTPAMVISAAIGITMAYSGYGVWALVWQTLSESLIFTLFLWLSAKWFPTFMFDKKVFRFHWKHGSRLLAVGLLGAVSRNILALIVGRIFGPAQLGLYSRAESFRVFVHNNTVGVVQRVSYPALVHVQSKNEKMKGLYRRVLRLTLMMCSVIYASGIILAKPLIIVVLTDKWLPAVDILVILSLAALFSPFNAINLNILKAKRRTDLLLKLEVSKSILFIGLILVASRIGFIYVVLCQLFMSLLALGFNNYFSNKLINYSLREQLVDVRPVILATAGASGVTWLLLQALSTTEPWVQLIACSACMAAVFTATMYIFWKPLLVEVWDVLVSIVKRKKIAEPRGNRAPDMKLLLTGGITGEYSRLMEYFGKERTIVAGCIDQLDVSTGVISHLKRVTVPDEYRDVDFRKDFRLTSASIVGSRLYISSATQALVFSWPLLELIRKIDSPYFNDIHHVAVINDSIYAVSTGLDAVLTFSLNGEFKSVQSVVLDDIWTKFNRDTDYRKIGSLKPHDAHPNFVFEMNGHVWCTRFKQKDIVRLDDLKTYIQISGHAGIHDGVSFEDSVFFTSVNGHIIELNKSTQKIVADLDLNKLDDRGVPLGWCRGLYVTKDYFFVGFSVLRTTKLEENLSWMNNRWKDKLSKRLPSRVAIIDRREKKLLQEFTLSYPDVDMIFTILGV